MTGRSWSPAFSDHVARNRHARQFACVRCGNGPVFSTWDEEWTHLSCLTPEERAEAQKPALWQP